jgi:precorrin-2 C20-methyltransferase/precorrin-3B C17-methyltransferase
MTGHLYGVGVGPGDPELVTVKAARVISAVDVVAFHSAQHGRSIARRIAAAYLRADQIEELLVYPVTTEKTDHPDGYQAAIDEFYAACAKRLASHLDAGRDVAVLSEGDPFFYGSYMHVHKRLAHRYPTTVVPGVSSLNAAAAAIGRPLAERDDVLTVLPGTLPVDVMAEHMSRSDATAVMKLGRTFPNVRAAFQAAGMERDVLYVERASSDAERSGPLPEIDPTTVPYMAIAIRPSTSGARPDDTPRSAATAQDQPPTGDVVVVGLGPAGPDWLTPQAAAALAEAEHLVGYRPYLDRVPARPGQQRHGSDNRVEAERATFALELARRGHRVAVVSSGDPGVFAMAAAVLEVACEPEWAHVPVRVVPGLTAAQAAASRVGAPLGHDFAVLSLSDRLKPWDIITDRLEAAARTDLVIAIYNPASQSRRWQLEAAHDLLLRYREAATPVVVARDVGYPTESVRTVRLDELNPAEIDMRCLLIVGSSQTRAVERAGKTAVWTSRRYPS